MTAGKTVVIHYLYHSAFTVQLEDYFLVFDYFPYPSGKGSKGLSEGVLSSDVFLGKSRPYVFASHGHGDHFHPGIFDWHKKNPRIRYVLSSDIPVKGVLAADFLEKACIIMDPYETIKTEDLEIKSFGSTDIGVSFLVKVCGMSIFHAGDLNWWHWAEESTEEELMEEEAKFKTELKRLHGEKIDIAFFPVDPRLGQHYYLGGEYFVKTFRPKLFIPMHFADKPEITRDFARYAHAKGVEIAVISKRGQEIIYHHT